MKEGAKLGNVYLCKPVCNKLKLTHVLYIVNTLIPSMDDDVMGYEDR